MAPLASKFTCPPFALLVPLCPPGPPGLLVPTALKDDFDDAVILISTDDEEPRLLDGEGFAYIPIKIGWGQLPP